MEGKVSTFISAASVRTIRNVKLIGPSQYRILTMLCFGVLVQLNLGCNSLVWEPTNSEARVRTESGLVEGYLGPEGAYGWFDIPYAQAPVGPLRWRAPRPVTYSEDLITRSEVGLMCPQLAGTLSNTDGNALVGQEDCLYLDITAPPGDISKLPVMIWIHGGSNTSGYKGTYDFSRFAVRESIVIVTLNYRLGVFGWFAHPALQDDQKNEGANFGTLDLIAALEWVQRNIEGFGGDPSNVTIFGESAGGRNVFSLLVAPTARGLFHKAIAQSGHLRSVSITEAHNERRQFKEIDRGSWEVVEALGFENRVVSADTLRDISVDSLLGAYTSFIVDHLQPQIIADDIVIPEIGLQRALGDVRYVDPTIPVMAGSNRDELTLWLGLNRYFVEVDYPLTKILPPRVRVKKREHYDAWVEYRSFGWKARGVDLPLSLLENAGARELYAYRYDWDGQKDSFLIKFSKLLGAAHASEIAFIQGAPMYGPIGEYMYPDTISARQMTNTMMAAWANFARFGNPGALRGKEWPVFSTQAPSFMILDDDEAIRVEKQFLTDEQILSQLISEPLFNKEERCILAWELTTALGEPTYTKYRKWNFNECENTGVRGLRRGISDGLREKYGSVQAM